MFRKAKPTIVVTEPARTKCISKQQQPDQDRWAQGYFCAVAVALREDGDTTIVRSLFKQGGDPTLADPVDIELFRAHGLMA